MIKRNIFFALLFISNLCMASNSVIDKMMNAIFPVNHQIIIDQIEGIKRRNGQIQRASGERLYNQMINQTLYGNSSYNKDNKCLYTH